MSSGASDAGALPLGEIQNPFASPSARAETLPEVPRLRPRSASAFIAAHTTGFQASLEEARIADLDATGLDQSDIQRFFELFAATERAVTVFSQGVNQSTSGTDKVNSILNCHLATGRIGKPGMGPLSVTGQPNAMGGRETGGLANMLAAHLDLESAEHR